MTRHINRARLALAMGASLMLLLGLATEPATAQFEDYMRLAMQHTQSKIYHEALVLPGTPDSSIVAVQFQLPFDRLVFMRHREGLPEQTYRASVEVTIELFEGNQVAVERLWRGETFAEDYDDTVDKTRALSGSASFLLPPGVYAYSLRLADMNTERAGSSLLRRVNVPRFEAGTIGHAVLASAVETDGGIVRITPSNLGRDIEYGKPAFAVIPFANGTMVEGPATDLKYVVRRLDRTKVRKEREKSARRMRSQPRRRDDTPERQRMEPETNLKGGVIVNSGRVTAGDLLPVHALSTSDVLEGMITGRIDTTRSSGLSFAIVDLNGTILEAGTYVLDVFPASDNLAAVSTRFSTHWRNMPISLHNLDVAIRNLAFMIQRRPAAEMRRGSAEEKEKRFAAFWRERDPTPGTVVNELMEEYYRRIDHAAFVFRMGSGGAPNGLGTDRADVYIAHGSPATSDRQFPPSGGVIEVWTYADGREFIFESFSSASEFRLVTDGS